ncbi:MAG: DUF1376 domain-containing protein [Rhodoferax sp.]|nr:DUF1376 domain-containing protein [Rhodoferax sp.]
MSQQTGYGRIVKEWMKVRAGALRGFVKCSDGRLYHPVVAEKAREAWQAKLEQRYRTECARIKKHNDRHGTKIEKPEFSEWLSLGCPQGQPLFVPRDKLACPATVPSETPSKGQGEGQGQGDSYSVPIGTGSKPPLITDPNEIIFGYGLALLTNAGTAEKQARSFLGLQRKLHGDESLIDKLRECAKAKPLQPLEWLAAAMVPPGKAPAKPGKHAGFDKLNYHEGIEADGSFA